MALVTRETISGLLAHTKDSSGELPVGVAGKTLFCSSLGRDAQSLNHAYFEELCLRRVSSLPTDELLLSTDGTPETVFVAEGTTMGIEKPSPGISGEALGLLKTIAGPAVEIVDLSRPQPKQRFLPAKLRKLLSPQS